MTRAGVGRLGWAAAIALLGCTPIRPLDPVDADRADAGRIDAGARTDAGARVDGGDAGPRGDAGGVDGCVAGAELCNGIDDDCDPTTEDGQDDPMLGAACDGPDTDGCEEGVMRCVAGALTCDDETGDSPEVCGGLDEDCDGSVDESGAVGERPWSFDMDSDRHGAMSPPPIVACDPPGAMYVDNDDDCDDDDPDTYPMAPELCDGRDNDCNRAIDETVVCDSSCDRAFFGGHTYQLCRMALTQPSARSACQSWGYDLVVIDDMAENSFLQGASSAIGSDLWIGLQETTPNNYQWVDGTPLGYTNWDPGTPMGLTCVRLYSATGRWDDTSCGRTIPWICESR